jgi:hypothetical protein
LGYIDIPTTLKFLHFALRQGKVGTINESDVGCGSGRNSVSKGIENTHFIAD